MTLVHSGRAIIRLDCAFFAGFFMLSAVVACLLIGADVKPPDAVVCARRECLQRVWVAAVAPLVEHRQRQGHRLALVPNSGSAAEVRAAIGKVAAGGALKYVLIVGDAEPAARVNPTIAARCVPVSLQPAVVNVKW